MEVDSTDLNTEALKRKERLQKMRNMAEGKGDSKTTDNLPK